MADNDNNPYRQVGKYLGLAFVLPTCAVVGWLIGHWLDGAFGTKFLTFVFLLFGIAAGFLELFRELSQDSAGK